MDEFIFWLWVETGLIIKQGSAMTQPDFLGQKAKAKHLGWGGGGREQSEFSKGNYPTNYCNNYNAYV